MRGAEGHSSMTVHIIPEGYDRLPEPAPRRDSIFDTPKSAAAFRAQVQHSGFVREPAAAGSALRDDDEAQQESWPREQRSRGHLRGLLLSRGCASLSTVVVLTALAVTAQQLIEHHDFRAVLLTAGIFCAATVLVAFMEIFQHCVYYSRPSLQKQVVRILLMPPIYAVASFMSLLFPAAGRYLDAFRELYEALTIYAFTWFVLGYLESDASFSFTTFAEVLSSRPQVRHLWPVSAFLRDWPMGPPFIRGVQTGVLNYVIVRPCTAVAAFSLGPLGLYHPGSLDPRDANPYIALANSVSQGWAIYCLVLLYRASADDLRSIKVLAKFLCVKGVVFATFWQGLAIAVGFRVGAIQQALKPHGGDSEAAMAIRLQNFLICVEMLFFAIAHSYAFRARDFMPQAAMRRDPSLAEDIERQMRLSASARRAAAGARRGASMPAGGDSAALVTAVAAAAAAAAREEQAGGVSPRRLPGPTACAVPSARAADGSLGHGSGGVAGMMSTIARRAVSIAGYGDVRANVAGQVTDSIEAVALGGTNLVGSAAHTLSRAGSAASRSFRRMVPGGATRSSASRSSASSSRRESLRPLAAAVEEEDDEDEDWKEAVERTTFEEVSSLPPGDGDAGVPVSLGAASAASMRVPWLPGEPGAGAAAAAAAAAAAGCSLKAGGGRAEPPAAVSEASSPVAPAGSHIEQARTVRDSGTTAAAAAAALDPAAGGGARAIVVVDCVEANAGTAAGNPASHAVVVPNQRVGGAHAGRGDGGGADAAASDDGPLLPSSDAAPTRAEALLALHGKKEQGRGGVANAAVVATMTAAADGVDKKTRSGGAAGGDRPRESGDEAAASAAAAAAAKGAGAGGGMSLEWDDQ